MLAGTRGKKRQPGKAGRRRKEDCTMTKKVRGEEISLQGESGKRGEREGGGRHGKKKALSKKGRKGGVKVGPELKK